MRGPQPWLAIYMFAVAPCRRIIAEAATWYRRAAEAGDAAAARALGSLYLTGAGPAQDNEEAARWLRRAAEAGDVVSQVDLANLVAHGGGGPEDPANIARWFAHDAISGDLVAAFNVGMCLAKGLGVDRDEEEAARWLRHAAEGVPEAQFIYGRLLAEGRGVRVRSARGTDMVCARR